MKNGSYRQSFFWTKPLKKCKDPFPVASEPKIPAKFKLCSTSVLQEAGKYKCEDYWNEDESEEKQFGKFFVKLIKSREICPDFLVRTMRLRWTADGGKGEEERTVCQFHYSAWPDHGVPTQVKPLLEMVRLIRDCQASETLPVLVSLGS